MKGNIRIIAVLLAISGGIGLLATYKAAAIIFSGNANNNVPIVYHFDTKISSQAKAEIKHHIQTHQSMRAQALIDSLCKQFNHLKQVYIQYAPQNINIHITAHEPCALINETSVVTTDGRMLNRTAFTDTALEHIKALNVPSIKDTYTQLPAPIFSWIQRTPDTIFKDFSITWIDENEIECAHKEDPHLIIRCTHTQDLRAHDIDACIYAKKQRTIAPQHTVVADIRFNRQVIISKK